MSSAVITLNKTNLLLSIPEVLVGQLDLFSKCEGEAFGLYTSCARVLVCSCARFCSSHLRSLLERIGSFRLTDPPPIWIQDFKYYFSFLYLQEN